MLNRSGITSYQAFLSLLLLLYTAIYGTLIVTTDFLPYVMDNNESFSSLWHAFNIYQFGIFESAGLADEAFSPHAAAHPYVHTHQGNFPRIFALVIFFLGARTIESQIAVTTFTVGLAAVFIAYHYLSKVGNALFAFLVCLVLMTDYILFAQWQVVTYRVWYGFFFFSTVMCAHQICGERTRKWVVLTVLNYLCLFYFELVFAAFLTILAGFYVAFINFRTPGLVVRAWLAQAAGMVLGLSILLLQWVEYLGWEGFVKDLFFTFIARNEAGRNPELLSEIIAFYQTSKVAFWYNFKDGAELATFWAFARSFFRFNWQVYTPFFSLIVLMLAGGWGVGLLQDRMRSEVFWRNVRRAIATLAYPVAFFTAMLLFNWWNEWMQHGTSALSDSSARMVAGGILGGVFLVIIAAYASPATMRIFLVASIYLMTSAIFTEGRLYGISSTAAPWYRADTLLGVVLTIVATIIVYGAVDALLRRHARSSPDKNESNEGSSGVIRVATLVFLGIAFFIRFHRVLYDQGHTDLWRHIADGWFSGAVVSLVAISAVLVTFTLLLHGTRAILGSGSADRLVRVVPLICAFFVAYCIIYMLSPGYVYTGYLERYAPFGVFMQGIVVGIVLYVAIKSAIHWFAVARVETKSNMPLTPASNGMPMPGFAGRAVVRLMAGSGLLLLLFLGGYWTKTQLTYLRLLPPNHYSFIKELAASPYAGNSFVVDNYAAPPAWYTKQWAYYDPAFSSGGLALTAEGYEFERERKYIWLADRDENREYDTPAYFLCMQPQSLATAVDALNRKVGTELPGVGCQTRNIVRRALRSPKKFPKQQLVGLDTNGIARAGYAGWAIVKLDWNFPPYLGVLDPGMEHVRVGLLTEKSGNRTRIRPLYHYQQQNGLSETGTLARYYEIGAGLSCDGESLTRRLIAESQDTAGFLLRAGFKGKIQMSVMPRSAAADGEEYYSAVYAVDGNKGLSEICTDGIPPDIPREVKSVRTNPTTVVLSWDDVADAAKFKIEMKRPRGDFSEIGESSVADSGLTEYLVGDLGPKDIYQFRVRACNRFGCSGHSQVTER